MALSVSFNQPNDLEVADDTVEALSLQLSEVTLWIEQIKERQNRDESPDAEIALNLFQQELVLCLESKKDASMARSISYAVASDGTVVSELYQQELQVAKDHDLATRFEAAEEDECPRMDEESNAPDRPRYPDTKLLDEPLSVSLGSADHPGAASSSIRGKVALSLARQKSALDSFSAEKRACVVCGEYFRLHSVEDLPCGHVYCHGCLKAHILSSLKDKTLFPPRCCRTEISQSLIDWELSIEEQGLFADTVIELATRDKTYCSNPTCGHFIIPAQIVAGKAVCRYCETATCALCKNHYHEDDCPFDTALQETLGLAHAQGWQRCFSCRSLVELEKGCYHMTCKCGSEFCYVCGAIWKECRCDAWNERNLVERAEEVVDREAEGPLEAPIRQERVLRMQEELRERHECTHSRRFERIIGGRRSKAFRCEMCGDCHRTYILQCRHCHMQVCESCRRTRVR